MNSILILLGKLVLFVSKLLRLGTGSTWPGHIALAMNPSFINDVINYNPKLKIILIAGTNGKTTTALMLQKILEQNFKVFRNESGANLMNGIASTLIKNSNLTKRLTYDVAIFEVDENNFGLATTSLNPYVIILLNLFRDQLDRYGEVNSIARKWKEALKTTSKQTLLFTNGDDPQLSFIAKESGLQSTFFGIEYDSKTNSALGYDVDFTYCPICQTKLNYNKVSYSHLGRYECKNCKFTNPKTVILPNIPYSLPGTYNIYNTNAAALVANIGFNIPLAVVRSSIDNFKPAFGRQEKIEYKEKDIILLLSKNPTGFNQSIEAVIDIKRKGNVLLLLNDKIPDGIDVSWIWDVDFEKLPQDSNINISGIRAYDLGLRFKYLDSNLTGKSTMQIFPKLIDAIDTSVQQLNKNNVLYILATYSAMLETRNKLLGRKIL